MEKFLNFTEYVNEAKTVGELYFDGYDDVIDYMKAWHGEQLRKFDKTPYFFHPARVAKTIEDATNNKTLVIASFLHDVLEDTDINWKTLAEKFGEKVAKLVQELTSHLPAHKKPNKVAYLIKKMLKVSDDALTIKLADRLDNVKDMQSPNVPSTFKDKVWGQTVVILKNIEKHRNLKPTQLKLISNIYKQLNNYKDTEHADLETIDEFKIYELSELELINED